MTDLPPAFRLLAWEELKTFDALIFCGGDAGMLMREVNRTGFHEVLDRAVESGLLYVGISAGSMIAAGNFEDGLKYIDNHIIVHCREGSACGKIQDSRDIFLTDEQAVRIRGDQAEIL